MKYIIWQDKNDGLYVLVRNTDLHRTSWCHEISELFEEELSAGIIDVTKDGFYVETVLTEFISFDSFENFKSDYPEYFI